MHWDVSLGATFEGRNAPVENALQLGNALKAMRGRGWRDWFVVEVEAVRASGREREGSVDCNGDEEEVVGI